MARSTFAPGVTVLGDTRPFGPPDYFWPHLEHQERLGPLSDDERDRLLQIIQAYRDEVIEELEALPLPPIRDRVKLAIPAIRAAIAALPLGSDDASIAVRSAVNRHLKKLSPNSLLVGGYEENRYVAVALSDEEPEPAIGAEYFIERLLPVTIKTIEPALRALVQALELAVDDLQPANASRKSGGAHREFVFRLMNLFEDVTGQPPTSSNDPDIAASRFVDTVDFVQVEIEKPEIELRAIEAARLGRDLTKEDERRIGALRLDVRNGNEAAFRRALSEQTGRRAAWMAEKLRADERED